MGNSLLVLAITVLRTGASRPCRRAPLRETGHRVDDVLACVVPTEGHGPQANRPESVVDFFKRHVFAGQRGRDEERLALPSDTAVTGDPTHFEMSRVLDGGQSGRVGAGRRLVPQRGRLVVERFMRAVVVVLRTETREAPLLRVRVWRWRTRRVGF